MATCRNRTARWIGLTILGVLVLMIIKSCKSSRPDGAVVVKPFDADKYLGKWYEIARKDFKHEKNLNNVTANYSKNADGSIKVVNKGFNYKANEGEEATGKAKFAGAPDEASLKVSFFGPFYSGYNVIAIDPDYQYALVAGESLDYLWLLSRTSTMPEDVKDDYLRCAQAIGYNTSDLVWVEQSSKY